MDENPLRALPKMDVLLACPRLEAARGQLPYPVLRDAARACLDGLRADLRSGALAGPPPLDALAEQVVAEAERLCRPRLRPVVNATGVVLHTNLGRAPLSEAAAKAAYDVALGYSNLEFDLDQGVRGSRHDHMEPLLCRLTGAEAALCVNNNAAAVFLLLSALCAGKKVAVSRGELVEIGGAFRLPDIMARGGAELCEVGTTNKTRLADYERAVLEDGAGALLKVHTSNYRIVGFSGDVSLAELAGLGRACGLPVFYDLGGGALSPGFLPQALAGPTAAEALADGADVVCFSADKLPGGPQAGVAVGKRRYIDAMKRDPIARVARIDKLSLAALEATLLLSLDPERARREIPALAMLGADESVLRERAEALAGRLAPLLEGLCAVSAAPGKGAVGGGALPTAPLPGWVVTLTPADGKAEALAAAFRGAEPPVLGRVHRGSLLLDMRTLGDGGETHVLHAAQALVRGG